MYLGPYNLYDVIKVGEMPTLEIIAIVYDLNKELNLSFEHNHLPLENNTINDCKDKNDKQVDLLYYSLRIVRLLQKENPDSSKRMNQLKYLSNTLDHFVNWYGDNQFIIPKKAPEIKWNKGIFSANQDFSIVTVGHETYELRPNQSKVVKLLFKNNVDELNGLSYREIARNSDLTSYGKLSNYFKDRPRVKDLFIHSKRSNKYTLII